MAAANKRKQALKAQATATSAPRKRAAPLLITPAPAKREAQHMAAKAAPDQNWFRKRLRELELTQAQAAGRIGVHAASLGRMLTGERDISAGEVVELARVLATTPSEVLRRLGLEGGGGLAPRGRVLQDGRVSYVVDTTDPVQLHGEYPVGAEALIVEAQEGPLSAWDGAVVVYAPSDTRGVGADVVGRLCVLEDTGSPLPVLGVLTSATGARGNAVRVFGTSEEIKPKRIVRASPVLGIHFRS